MSTEFSKSVPTWENYITLENRWDQNSAKTLGCVSTWEQREIKTSWNFQRACPPERTISLSRVSEIKTQRKISETCPLYLIKQVRRAVSEEFIYFVWVFMRWIWTCSSVLHFVWWTKYWENGEQKKSSHKLCSYFPISCEVHWNVSVNCIKISFLSSLFLYSL